MTVVSSQACRWIFEILDRAERSSDELLCGLPEKHRDLQDPTGFVEWASFATLCERAEQILGGPEALRDAAVCLLHSQLAEARSLLQATGPGSASQILWILSRWVAPRYFPSLDWKLAHSDESMTLHVSSPADAEACRSLFDAVGACIGELLREIDPQGPTAEIETNERSLTFRIARDVTDWAKTEAALRESENRYRVVSELSSDYNFAVCIEPDGTARREWVTEAFARITGYQPEEMPPARWRELVHADDQERIVERFDQVMREGSGEIEYRIHTRDGEIRWLRERLRVVREADGRVWWYGACQDVTEQKIAEEARSISEQRHAAIAENARDVIIELDSKGRILYVTPNVHDVLGYPADQVMGRRPQELVHSGDLQTVTERVQKMLQTGNPEQITYRVRTKHGRWRYIDATASAFRTPDGEVRGVLINRDVTEVLRNEQERARLSSVVESSTEFIAILSLDGRILFLNQAGARLVGLENESEIRSRNIFDLLGAEDARSSRFTVFPEVLRSGHWEGEYELRHISTGEPIATLAHIFQLPDHWEGEVQAMALVARDISARKCAEQALQQSEERFRMLVENAFDLISETTIDGRFVYVSPKYREILGYAAEDLLGTMASDLIHSEDKAEILAAAQAGMKTQEARLLKVRIRDRSGRWHWMESQIRRYRGRAGEPLVVVISRDVTERRAAEEALRQSQEQLIQSQKMEAIGRLAGGVAHDFNNLLTAITGYGDLLLDELGPDHPLRADAEEIIRAAEQAGGLTRQLLAFSRRQLLQPRVIDLNALVADVDRLLRRLIGEHIDLVSSLDGQLWPVKVDPGQMEQLILNLAVNARDAMLRGGRLSIRTSNRVVDDESASRHPGVSPGEWVTLSVRDTGIGMNSDTLDRIFEPFFTTKATGKGTGLGLSMVYGIVEQSGGKIRVTSEPDRGSTFTVYLPRTEEDPEEIESHPILEDFRGDETVLLVEDAEPVRRMLRRYLDKHGYRVLEAASGVEALRLVRHHEGPLDLLMTDVVLPKLDGQALARRLQASHPSLKVLYMSGFSDEALVENGMLEGSVALIQKPFSPPDLLRRARSVLAAPAVRA